MLYLRWIFFLLVLSGLSFLACDNPLQSQQKVDSWENRILLRNRGELYFPTCSPDGSTVAFVRGRLLTGMYSFDYSGNQSNTIFLSDRYLLRWRSTPQLSPDGAQIAYTTWENLVVVENIESGETRIIFQEDYTPVGNPKWSADGLYLYYLVNYDYIEKVAIDGSDKSRVEIGDKLNYLDTFDLSPDGSRYLVAGRGKLDDAGQELFLLSVADEKIIQITENQYHARQPSWSPDGNSIAYFGRDSTGVADLILMTLEGTVIDTLGHGYRYFSEPNWSRDGRIIFHGYTGYENSIYEYSLSEKVLLTLCPLPYGYSFISLNPVNENELLFTFTGQYYNLSTITMDSTVTDLTSPTTNQSLYPAWTPDGEHILYSNEGLHRISKQGGDAEKIDIPSPNAWQIRSSISPDRQILTANYGSSTSFYDYNTLELLFSLSGVRQLSWAPQSDKFLCIDYDHHLAIYEKQNENFVKQYSYDIERVYSVDWAKTEQALGLDILCCAERDDDDSMWVNYDLFVFDDTLENSHLLMSHDPVLYASWIPNSTDFVYSYGSRMRIRRAISNF